MALVLFYRALNLVNAVGEKGGHRFSLHPDRDRYLRDSHPREFVHYKTLERASKQARYLAFHGFTMTADQVHYQLRMKSARAIELWAESELGVAGLAAPAGTAAPGKRIRVEPLDGIEPPPEIRVHGVVPAGDPAAKLAPEDGP